jgi:hypothetical protein
MPRAIGCGMWATLYRFIEGFIEGFNAEHRRLAAFRDQLEQEEQSDKGVADEAEEEDEVSDVLILEIVERAHERFASRLDTLDTVLIGLMAAILAIGAMAIDKYTDLKPSLAYFEGSLGCCVFGWLLGNVFWQVREPVSPSYFIAGVATRGAGALLESTRAIATAYERRTWVRAAKMVAVAGAMVCLLGGIFSAIRAESMVD